jgi:hypothetical protein
LASAKRVGDGRTRANKPIRFVYLFALSEYSDE